MLNKSVNNTDTNKDRERINMYLKISYGNWEKSICFKELIEYAV